jgi:hypothetical protein
MASDSRRICVADSSSSTHRSQVGSSVSPSLKWRPLKWQCPVNSSTTNRNWFLSSSNRFFVLLAEGPCISPFAWSSPIMTSQCSFVISTRPVPDLFLGNSNLDAASWFKSYERMLRSCYCQLICLPFYYQRYPHDMAPISVELCYGRADL